MTFEEMVEKGRVEVGFLPGNTDRLFVERVLGAAGVPEMLARLALAEGLLHDSMRAVVLREQKQWLERLDAFLASGEGNQDA